MPLLAEVFWKEPNVYDAAGLLGLIAGIASIWLAIKIAKKDIQKQLAEAADRAERAARDEVRRVAQAVLQSGVTATIRSLELAREVCNGKRWARAVELCILASEQLARVTVQPVLNDGLQAELRAVSTSLVDCVSRLRTKKREGAGEIPDGVLRALDEALLTLHRVEGSLSGIKTEENRG